MTLSILHRVTGVALSIGLIALVVWLQSIAFGAKPYAEVSALMSTLIGRTCLLGWSFAFFLHLANGIRHLFWDVGLGFEKKQADFSAWLVIVSSIILTGAYWMIMRGGER
jgi:succinate dehydrogenase / fumarate reductase cytochrome b subunit